MNNDPKKNSNRRTESASQRRVSSGRPPQRSSSKPHYSNGSAPKRKNTSLTRPEDRSLVEIVKDRALATQRKKDAQWDNKEIQRVRHGVDRPMLIIILVLIVLGTIMVFSASYPNALREKNDSLYYIRNQLLWVTIGGGVMLFAAAIPYKIYKAVTPSVCLVSVALLLLVLVIGTAEGVARRWIVVGPLSIQPSEIAKAALIMTLAYYIDGHYDVISKSLDKKKKFWLGIVFPGVIVGVFCALVLLEKHLSGTIILGLIGMSIIFVSGADVLKMVLFYGIPAACAGGLYLATNSYALQRITTHNDANADVLAEAWQTTQGLYAIGSGGLLGMGLGESNLKYNYVSAAHNDFIFTIWCEELGLVGAILLICLYGLFVWRGFVIARKAPDTFTSLLAFGITFQVGIQAALNIMVVTDLIPNTGVSLPFFSYGGSSLVMLMGEMGILLNISKHSYQNK